MAAVLYVPEPAGVTARLRQRLLHALLPSCCLGCGRALRGQAPLGLCAGCRGRLRRADRRDRDGGGPCAGCGRRLAGPTPRGYRCGRCRAAPPACDRLLALWSYEEPLTAVVQRLKFGRLDYLGRHLANAMALELGAELAGLDLVVPVPLHWRRRLARGYNQAERIARPLALRLGLPFAPALRRSRATPPQTSLGRAERLSNLERAFQARAVEPPLRGRRVLLVDDVATTGATLNAAARALKRAGAAQVVAVVAGRTPDVD
ncbi:MAG TPA: ComF family protein [Thermoanaerobaculia bacterium]|nr:ComF family protein [Thermoanaerobaculia bacterium]